MDSSAKRPTQWMAVALCLLCGCSIGHDLAAAQVAGGLGSEPYAGLVPDRNAVGPGNICRRLAEILCEAERNCCSDPRRDMPSCLTALETSCADEALIDQIAAQPEAGFDPVQAEAVFGEIERLASACDPSVVAFSQSLAGLRSMFAGSAASDGSCTPALASDGAQAGAALVACRELDRQACVPGLIQWRCTPIAAEAGACFSDLNCQAGLYCTNPELQLAGGQCAPRRETGASCAFDNECQSSFCRDGVCVQAERELVYCPR